ncbi:MAG: S9 family peptidase [Pseudomonadota bacterium]
MTVNTSRARLLGAALAIGLIAVPAAQAQRAMTIEDLFEIRQVGGAQIAPDGDQIFYTVSVPRNVVDGEDDGVPHLELHITDGAGESRTFIAGQGRIGAVAWAPGGDAITFLDRRDGDDATTVYSISASGGEAQRLFGFDQSIQSYVITPDGESIFFIARDEADPTISSLRSRGFRANVFEEDYTFSHVWKADLDGDDAPERLALPGHPSQLSLSENGERLAVALAPTPLVDDSLMSRRWHVIDADDGDVISVIETPGKIGSAVFSPNARRLAFLAGADRADPTAGTLHVANARNGEYEAIAREAEQHIMQIAWRDNDTMLTLAHVGAESALVEYEVSGEESARAPADGVVYAGMDFHRDSGRVSMVAHASTHPRELFVDDGAGWVRWTDHNPQLADIEFAEQSVFEYTARDGVRVEGVLMTPAGDAPNGGWPMIMTVHGGPEAHDSNGWLTGYSRAGHIGTGEGFAVFYPNYRGSTGRGEVFAKLDHLDPPGEEFNDLVDAIGALSEAGIIDPDRVGITGGSYGGFASAWGATVASEHFAASVPFVALTELISFFGTTEIPVEMIDVHFMEYPWQNWPLYLEYSPTFHAQGSTTPTLIIHGEEDTRVDASQSYILYRMLKMAGEAPVRLVTYPGEGHGNRNAAAQYDYAHRVMRWMKHYLQGEGGEPPAHELPLPDLLGMED